ncbi:MAG: phage tail assembly protein [Symploca sp. SIO3C6]|uniref:Phage tail assembly protein n=1 Tax=Symploca sp. SIO1C4 TaxID=2607765 RepID=A0A6B3NEX4_9CYAN|nr:phage tail assembly protein [Symploca sp. SIO3C6]NER30183.1 phage tail assembly protein [Symploca sp. SIO1C4]NET04231.1 phage tail assembly protein [Symploca sp. SIO2B6]NET53405.1 phage tail assembly protein [Merismopedia sp. SIO2A8]
MLQTEYDFTLPSGYVDSEGNLHREGIMRLATAADEILPLKDPRVQNNPAYLIVILLSRVVTRLGSVETINPKVIEGLFASDLAYLQDLYNRLNGNGMRVLPVKCPHCGGDFEVELDMSGES